MLVPDGKGCGWIDRHILLVIRLMVLFVPTSEFHIVCCHFLWPCVETPQLPHLLAEVQLVLCCRLQREAGDDR